MTPLEKRKLRKIYSAYVGSPVGYDVLWVIDRLIESEARADQDPEVGCSRDVIEAKRRELLG